MSGCPHNCCANLIAEIGLAGKIIREDGKRKQTYDISFGGEIGVAPQFGRLVEKKVPAGEVKYKITSLISNYVKLRKPSELLGKFCNRHTVEELRTYINTGEGYDRYDGCKK